MERTILHCDMNNFYASVECMLDMSLKGKAVAVGGDVENRHGIILAKNYEAKKYGVQTDEALWQARQKCRNLVIVPPHYEQYIKYSKLARQIYAEYTDLVEPSATSFFATSLLNENPFSKRADFRFPFHTILFYRLFREVCHHP